MDAMSVLAIVTLFAKGIYEYTIRAMDKLNSILKSELADMDQEDVYKRQCQESAKFAVRDRYQVTLYPTPTDIPEENGMLISRL